MGNWQIELGLGALGLTPEQQQVVEAQIPNLQALVEIIQTHTKSINQAVKLITALAPAARIVADALKAKETAG